MSKPQGLALCAQVDTVETPPDVFAAYAKLLLEGFKPESIMISIDSLQSLRPDLTDEFLAAKGIIRGVHFVIARDGAFYPGEVPD